MPEPMRRDVRMLGDILGVVIRDSAGPELLADVERLRRAVIEASKQCGRNRLMEIAPPQRVSEYLAVQESHTIRLLAHPCGKNCDNVLKNSLAAETTLQQILLAIGPEGGFSATEIELASSHDWQFVNLGPRILRIETAALALAAVAAARLELA